MLALNIGCAILSMKKTLALSLSHTHTHTHTHHTYTHPTPHHIPHTTTHHTTNARTHTHTHTHTPYHTTHHTPYHTHTHTHTAPFCCTPGETPSTCLDRLSCSPLKPAKDWLRMMPLGPPGEKDWDPTSMISGSLVGSPVDRGKSMVTVR